MHRRVFVRSGALALITMGLSPSFLRRTAFGVELPKAARGKTLICLFQRGAASPGCRTPCSRLRHCSSIPMVGSS